jgi:hypothetical protein
MVFQGTVLGPPLWNTFYRDARQAIEEWFYTEIVYADDLNAYRIFTGETPDETIWESLNKCQAELHEWGDANQVTFDPEKESHHIVSLDSSAGTNFKQLGIDFDCNLHMGDAINDVVTQAGWKLRTLLRTR